MREEAFWMPLHTDHKRVSGEFHGLNDPIARTGTDDHPLTRHFHGLMVQAVDPHIVGGHDGGETSPRDDIHEMGAFWET